MRFRRWIFAFGISAFANPTFALFSPTTTVLQETSSSSSSSYIPQRPLFSPSSSSPNNDTPATENSSCIRGFSRTPIFQISTFIWTIHIPGQMMPSTQGSGDWGGGLLDNLRLCCGSITMWFAQLDSARPPHTGIEAMFYSQICTLQNVEEAAFAASDPQNRIVLRCEFPHGGGGVSPIIDESGFAGDEMKI